MTIRLPVTLHAAPLCDSQFFSLPRLAADALEPGLTPVFLLGPGPGPRLSCGRQESYLCSALGTEGLGLF